MERASGRKAKGSSRGGTKGQGGERARRVGGAGRADAGVGDSGPGEASYALADRLHSVAIHLLRQLRREDDASGLSAPRLSALSVLVYGGRLTIGQLAAAEQVRPPTMTRLIQALERDGLVQREPDVADGRVVRVRATARGKRLLEEGRRRRVAALAATLESLSPADRRALERSLGVLESLLRQ